NNECQIGDTVEVVECRPISRHKTWRVVNIVERAEVR
ncbi:MAG: 30S ribosomal protein S17, partial [Gammaproteobacteria bacterium]